MKPQYRIRNWSEYNAGLKQRGSLTFWLDESVLEQWVVEELSGKPGASVLYSDLAIQTMATVKAVYRLAGRQCQGFLESIFELMESTSLCQSTAPCLDDWGNSRLNCRWCRRRALAM
jgi:hypothetical protein